MPRIVCLSDTHNCHEQITVPDGDVLLHAGDATNNGTIEEIKIFSSWFQSLPHQHKIFIAGNHDRAFENLEGNAEFLKWLLDPGIIYLQDSFVTVENLKIYGSPWQPWFYSWAFNLPRGAALAEKWRLIPHDTDILITHGPPQGILDASPSGEPCGCEELIKVVAEIKPKLHLFGHIHHSYGAQEKFGGIFANGSNCDESYEPTNAPLVFDL